MRFELILLSVFIFNLIDFKVVKAEDSYEQTVEILQFNEDIVSEENPRNDFNNKFSDLRQFLKQDLDIDEKVSLFEGMFGKLLLRTLHENDMSAVDQLIEEIVEDSHDIQHILEYA
jgi:hypothetical protein